MTDAFDSADFYDAGDADALGHETVADALEEVVQAWAEPGDTNRRALERYPGVLEVRAFKRDDPPDDDERDSWAMALVEQLEELWDDSDYGNPDEPPDPVDGVQEAMRAVVDKWIEGQEVWSCSEVGRKTYTVDEAVAVLGED